MKNWGEGSTFLKKENMAKSLKSELVWYGGGTAKRPLCLEHWNKREKRRWRRRKQDHMGHAGDFELNLKYTGKLLQDFKQGRSII